MASRSKKGDKVFLWYNSGNRDEDVFSDGDKWVETPERLPSCFTHGFHKMMVTVSKGV